MALFCLAVRPCGCVWEVWIYRMVLGKEGGAGLVGPMLGAVEKDVDLH